VGDGGQGIGSVGAPRVENPLVRALPGSGMEQGTGDCHHFTMEAHRGNPWYEKSNSHRSRYDANHIKLMPFRDSCTTLLAKERTKATVCLSGWLTTRNVLAADLENNLLPIHLQFFSWT